MTDHQHPGRPSLYRWRVMSDPSPYPLATGARLSTEEVDCMLSIGTFTAYTRLLLYKPAVIGGVRYEPGRYVVIGGKLVNGGKMRIEA